MADDGSRSFYFFDIDDNLLFLPTKIYLWNAERQEEKVVSSGEFASVQNALGREGTWQPWAIYERTFRDFRDDPGRPIGEQTFITDLGNALDGDESWKGPSWPLLVHAAEKGRATAFVTARGHARETIEAGFQLLFERGYLPAVPEILGVYTVSNPDVRVLVGAVDPAMTVPSVKKLAIKHAVAVALERYGSEPMHRFGMSDDDPNNVVLAISAMRDLKLDYPDKRFFVVNTNHEEFVKLEIFPMAHPVTAAGEGRSLLAEEDRPGAAPPARSTSGGNASVYVSDMERAIDFYSGPLGLPLRVRVGTEWAELDAGGGLIIGLHVARPPATVPAGTRGAINIELAATRPLDDVVADLQARGVRFKGDIQNYPAVRIATALDPDDNELVIAEVLDAGTPNAAA